MKKEARINKSIITNFISFSVLFALMILITYISLGGKYRDYNAYDALDGGDGTATEMIIKGIHEYGLKGLYFNERVAAPDVASYIDANGLDTFMAICIILIDKVMRTSPACTYLLFLYLTFILNSWTMFYLLRKLNISYINSVIFSALFSIAPYHFYRYLVHISIGNAFSVPIYILFALFAIGVIECDSVMDKIIFAFLGFFAGLSNPYFIFFGLILAFLAFLYNLINNSHREIKGIIKKYWVYGISIFTFILSQFPSVMYRLLNGSNPIVFIRSYAEQELYSLNIIQMLLPVIYSRIPILSAITGDYYSWISCERETYMASLGIIAGCGFIWICILFFILFISNKKDNDTINNDYIKFLVLSVVTFVVVGASGGIGEIFNMLITPQFRCYNRESIYITAICLAVMAYFFDKIKFKKQIITFIMCLALLFLGIYDSVYICSMDYNTRIRDENNIYKKFFQEAEESMPDGAMIYQLPFADYPEVAPVNNLQVSKHFVGYLFTDHLRWSYGGIKGRDYGAKRLYYMGGENEYFIASLIEAGFSGVYIDCDGFEDGGEEIVGYYKSMGFPYVVSENNMLYLFDISGFDMNSIEKVNYKTYEFVYYWIEDYYGQGPEEFLCAGLAVAIENGDLDAIESLYSYIETKDICQNYSNDEYVKFLYKRIFNVIPSDEAMEYWRWYLSGNYTRKDVFESFLLSQNFYDLLY